MNFERIRGAGAFVRFTAAAALCTALAGCFGLPDLDSTQVTPTPGMSPERAQAIAEMRAQAVAGEKMPYPDAFQREQTARLATRGEPLTISEVDAIQAELGLIAKRRAVATDAREIAALEARERELRALVLASGREPVRQ
jgi:hypothetical protein